MIAKFTFNYNGAFEKKENAVFQQGSLGVDSYQVYAPFPTTTQVFIKTKRNGDLEFSLWKQLDYNSTIGGWLKTATADELLVNGELKVVFKFGNLVSQETSLWVREGTLVVPQMTTYEALRDYVENQEIRINQIIDGSTSLAFDNTGTDLDSVYIEEAIKEVNDKSNTNEQNIVEINLELDGIDQEIIDAKSRLDDLEQFEATVPTIYETIANVDLVRDDVTDLETFANTTVPATYETKVDANVERVRITNLENTRETKADATSKLAEAKAYADSVVDSVYDYKGSVAFESLPTTGQKVGDTYNITNDFTLGGNNYLAGTDVAWDGTGWNSLSSKTPNASQIDVTPPTGMVATKVQGAIDELNDKKVDKDFTTYQELSALEIAESDELIVRDISSNTTKKVRVSTLRGFETDTYEYGVREVVGQSASEFERVKKVNGEMFVGSATNLVANVAINGATVLNSFDNIDIFNRVKENITATDLSSNSVSNTFVKVRKYYIKEEWVKEGGVDYHYLWMCAKNLTGYRLPLPFKKTDGTERDYAYMGAYEAFLDANNKLRSLTGQFPRVTYSRNNFRTAARALDGLGVNSKYQITDLAEYVDLVQIPFMIEFATKHSQGVFLGATSMAYSATHTAVADGTSVNFIVVSNATGANFVLGQTISIGTANSNSTVANDRVVTLIEVDTPNAGETKITFDGAAVNIVIGNVIASRGWKTGATDQVKVSGTHALNDGKHSIVWRGLENPFGNIWKNVDGVKISNWRGYVAENPKDYNDTASVAGVYAEPYLPLGYLNADTNNYAQDLGYDANYPYAKFPISVQASSGLFFRDYYYQNSGDRTAFVGGTWFNSSSAGVFFWDLYNGLGYANFYFGARLSYRP